MSRRKVQIATHLTLVSLIASLFLGAPAGASAGFGDVGPGEFFTAPVQWMADEGLTSGTSPGCFSPSRTASRGEVAALLHRYAGEPDGAAEQFSDVGADDYYASAVGWMAGEGITTGTSPDTFAPDRSVTRGELATFLHRFVGRPAAGGEPFVDVTDSDFFSQPVAWMVASGITTGTSPVTFHPGRPVTRGELAAFLYRMAGSPAVTVSSAGACAQTAVDPALAAAEAASWALLNDLRASVGLPVLPRDPAMDEFARDWSATMATTRDFSHSGGPYGENIAWWSAGSATPELAAQRLHDLWVGSAGHYANMTRTSYTEVGIGFSQGPGGWYATHVFR